MKIRQATMQDIEDIMKIYQRAAAFMAESGNPNQWTGGYPGRELAEQDILTGISYVITYSEKAEAVFTFELGEDPTYRNIENGSWQNDEPYGTVHRLASLGHKVGAAKACFDWCASQCSNLRADTHPDNRIMQHLLKKNGFINCGEIYLADGAPRMAFGRVITESSYS